jgi:carbamoyl-phosphate synthase/aspartate carbamoyltransferase
MVGYPESLTDPSYSSQILVLTYPIIGSYGVPARPATLSPTEVNPGTLPAEFESSKIHVAALIVGSYNPAFSHYLAQSSLGSWLKEQGVPAIWGVDTRALTKRLREKGVTLGRVLARKDLANGGERGRKTVPALAPSGGLASIGGKLLAAVQGDSESKDHLSPSGTSTPKADWRENYQLVPFSDPNASNLVATVSVAEPVLYTPQKVSGVAPSVHPREGRPLRVIALDVGMKYNQIRCFTKRGIEVKVLPWVCLLPLVIFTATGKQRLTLDRSLSSELRLHQPREGAL